MRWYKKLVSLLSSFAGVDSHPAVKVVQEMTSWSIDDAQSLNSNGLKQIPGIIIIIITIKRWY